MIPDRIAPIPFDMPPPDHGCAGKWRPFKACFVALCHGCNRFSKGGPQIDPVARIVHGGSICPNFLPIADVHATHLAPHQPAGVCLSVGGRTNPKTGEESAFRNAGVTLLGVAK